MAEVLLRQPVTDALLAMLRATTSPDARPLRIGDHRAPEPVPPALVPETPFAVLSVIDETELYGTWDDPHTDGRMVFQLSSVGDSRRSAEWMADQVRKAVLGRAAGDYLRPITPTEGALMGRDLHIGGPTLQDGDWWNVVDQYALFITNA